MRKEAQGVIHVLHVPSTLPPSRLRRWCDQRVRLDLARARRKGKTISRANARRMLTRRLAAAGCP